MKRLLFHISILLALLVTLLPAQAPIKADTASFANYQDAVVTSATRYYYLSEWKGMGQIPNDPFEPVVAEYTNNWAVIDLRPDGEKVDGYGIVSTDGLLEIKNDSRITLICNGVDLNSPLTGSIKNELAKAFSVTVKGLSLPEVIQNVLADTGHIITPEQDGKVRLNLNGQLAGAKQPAYTHSTIADSFTRGASGTLGSSSEGWTWTTVAGSFGINGANQAFQNAGFGVLSLGRANSDLGSQNMYSQCTIENDIGTQGAACRIENSANNTYYAAYYVSPNTVRIYKVLGGAGSSIAGPTAVAYGAGKYIKLTCNGSTLTSYFDGAFVNSTSDTAIAGTYQYAGISGYENGVIVDNFSASQLLTTPTIITSVATSISSTTATLNAQLTSSGGENATVRFFWGTTNGGTTAASWSNNATATSPSQPQGEALAYYNATGLTDHTLYYFTASANNTGGTSWGNVQAFYTSGYSPSTSSGSWADPTYAYSWESNNVTLKMSDSSSNETYGGYGISLGSANITQVLIKPFAFSSPATGVLDSNQPTANSNGTYAWNNPERAYDPGGSASNNYTTGTFTTPTYRATGTAGYATTGNVTVGLPAGMSSGDIVILVASCNWTNTVSILANGSIGTWTAIASPKKPTTSNLLSENLYVWWGLYSSGSTGPTIIGTDHVVGRTIAYSNCNTTSPIDVSSNGTEETSDTSMNFVTGLTTTYNNELVCIAASTGVSGNSTAAFASWADANLTSVTERMDNRTAAGGGGGFGFAEGLRAVAGAVATANSTYAASSYKSFIAFALRPTMLTTNEIQQIYKTFGFTDVGGTITKVEIGYEAFATATQKLNLCVSSNGGGAWSSNYTTANLATADPNAYTYVDVTDYVGWTWTLLNDANFQIRLGSKWVNGSPTFSVDNLIVRVTYNDAADEQLRVDVSWNGGTTWANADNVTLTSSEATYTVNATGLTSWTATKLSDANFKVAIFPLTVGATSNVSVDWLPVVIYYTGEAAKSITNTPSSVAFGVVRGHTTSYSGGGAYSNPVTDGQCLLTITNTGGDSCDLMVSMTDWTAVGGNTWNLVATSPDGDEIRITVVYSGQNPASGLVLTNADQTFYEGLNAGNTLKWDIKIEFGGDSSTGLFSDGKQHTGTITVTAS